MKGIVLAGGSGTRLFPITKGMSKQLLPIYDKPMIYYPISVLMQIGIKEILIISTPNDIESYKRLLGNGKNIGIDFQYIVQPKPDGIASAFILGENFIGDDNVCLILGDNIFYGEGLHNLLFSAKYDLEKTQNANIFGYLVNDPQRYGVVEFDDIKNVISIEEKPKIPKSNFAVVGLYFYPNQVIDIAKKIQPSKRGELEITSINEFFLKEKKLKVNIMGRGFAWLDTGTHESLNEAGEFIKVLENRQGLKIACLEEIAFEKGYINSKQALRLAESFGDNGYGKYLLKRIKEHIKLLNKEI